MAKTNDRDETATTITIVSRRTTEDAVGRLAETNTLTNFAAWYEPGKDFCFYANAYQACRSSKERLLGILSPEDLRELEANKGIEVVIEKINQVSQEIAKKSHKSTAEKKTADFINGFCDFAWKTSAIVSTLLPQSPEYTVTFGVIMLIFKTVVTKKEREETLMAFIKTLIDRLPVVDFYKSIFPTYDMKLAVASIYVGITKLLEDALIYFRNGRLSKLLDAIIRPKEGKFQQQINDIDRAIEKIDALRTAANMAQQSDMKTMLEDAGHVVARIHQNLEGTTAALGSSMAFLNQKVDAIQARTDELLEFESFKYSLALRQILLPDIVDYDADFEIACRIDFELTPKDQWDENGILDDLLEWSTSGRSTLFWIGGSSGNQDSWVTPLSLDMIEAFRGQEVTLIYALCNNIASTTADYIPSIPDDVIAHRALTPRSLLRHLIAQLLTHHPHLAFQNPRLFNEYRFTNAISFKQLWSIFEQLALRVPKELFIVLDRIEQTAADEDIYVQDVLLPALMELASDSGERISVVVTSVLEPPLEIADDERLTQVYKDTGKRPRKRGIY